MRNFYLFLLVLFISACSNKPTNVLNHFEQDPQSANAIQYTKKGDIIYENEIKAMFFATYLNKINQKYETDKLNSFSIGVHLINKDNHDFEENEYTLTLNNKAPLSTIDIKTDSNLVKFIPLKNTWGKYYLVQFENEPQIKKLTLNFSHPTFGSVRLNFQK